MRRVAPCLALFLALAGTLRSSTPTPQTPSLPELPRLAIDGLVPTARAVVQQAYDAVVVHPLDASANGKLGMVLHAHNLLRESEACYGRARLLDPASFRWAYFLGLVQAERGGYEEAITNLREALRLDPEYLPAQLNLGEYLLASGQWQEAANLYEAILEKHPGSARAHYGLGRARAVRKDLNGAVQSFRKACDLFPNFGPAHYALAQSYKRLGNTDQGLEHLTLYRRNGTSVPDTRDPLLDEVAARSSSPEQQLRLGMALAREGKLEEAVAAHEKALEIDPRLVEAHVNLISLYGHLGQFAKGEEHFRAALELDPKHPKSFFSRGLLLAGQGRFLEAGGAFRKTLEIDPLYPDARLNLGLMLEAQEKLSEAMVQYEKALESSPEDARAHFNLGRILVNQEDYQKGIQHLLKTLVTADEEGKPSYLYALGAAYARSGDRKNGLLYLRLAREKAVARGRSKLVESIDEDLRTLEEEGTSPPKLFR